SDPVERLAAWITSQPSTQPCIESRYSTQVAAHTNTSYDSPQATSKKLLLFQGNWRDLPP
ncbi:jg307, partial [Pararge aegeria aegeria]